MACIMDLSSMSLGCRCYDMLSMIVTLVGVDVFIINVGVVVVIFSVFGMTVFICVLVFHAMIVIVPADGVAFHFFLESSLRFCGPW